MINISDISILSMIIMIGMVSWSPSLDAKENKHANRLGLEKSPYLLQHADNPVDWYPWGQEAFDKAKSEDKPVFLSIGYSTCHWCHVMEEESFENTEIARFLNENFVSIKVDREERPDIDNIYMAAVLAMTGQGGWPMSVFLTPDGTPFYGGTYFPPKEKWGQPGFINVLASIDNAWRKKRKDVLKSSESLVEAIKARQLSYNPETIEADIFSPEIIKRAYEYEEGQFDAVYGGFGTAPKFPMAFSQSLILRHWLRSGDSKALQIVEKTLRGISYGGIYDQLGGGVHRYSTDKQWRIPHFEKMLYDQAIITKAYIEAYQSSGKEEYSGMARDIFEFVLKDMTGKDGGFYSAFDADSYEKHDDHAHKKEGAYYLWKYDEIISILGQEYGEVFIYHFGIRQKGNAISDPQNEFTDKNVLYVAYTIKECAKRFNKDEREIKRMIDESKAKLLKEQGKRPKPHLDDKVLVDWNGLMISSFAVGGMVLREPKYINAAKKSADFILANMVSPDGRLLHRWREGEAGIDAMIDDYAFFVHGLIDLYEATFEIKYLESAVNLTDKMIDLFWDDNQGGFFSTARDNQGLFIRQREIYDGAIPSGNSVAALNLARLVKFTAKNNYSDKLEELFRSFSRNIIPMPAGHLQILIALDFILGPSKEIVIAEGSTGMKAREVLDSINMKFIPRKVVILRSKDMSDKKLYEIIPFIESQAPIDSKTAVYICENYTCDLPITDISSLTKKLDGISAR